jgi:hypothetical protein
MKKAIVRVHQTLTDIAVQYCGSAEAVFALARLNGLSVTDSLTAGQELILPEKYNNAVARIFEQEEYFPAVLIEKNTLEGIDYDIIEFDLEVQ